MTRFFCPGRLELAGNHTDHQRGRVMAAAMDRGITAEAEPNGGQLVRIFCEGFEPVEVDLTRLWPDENEKGTSAALIRGTAEALAASIPTLQGFDAYLTSDLPAGQGLASSSAFAVLIGFMLSAFSASAQPVPAEELARAALRAETRWFGKPCSLADTLACALGGGVYVDVLENKIVPIACDFDSLGLAMCLTDTGGTAIPSGPVNERIAADMAEVAQTFGEPFLSRVRGPVFDAAWQDHQDDPKWTRARHFFDETWRVASMADALGLRDGSRYMELMNQSGRSAEVLLKSVWSESGGDRLIQGLTASRRLLDGVGAWRAHSGFAGYVQALMPATYFPLYQAGMDDLFGANACRRVHICPQGVGLAQGEKQPSTPHAFPQEAEALLD